MKIYILLSLLSFVYSATVLPNSSRIAHGHAAAPNQFPYQVTVQSPVAGGICGGSIISSSWVLTAAHCTIGHSQISLRFGSLNVFTGGIAQTSFHIINHAAYNPLNLNNDISLVSIPSPLTFTAAIQSVRLPTLSQFGTTFENAQATASGWGMTEQGGGVQQLLRWVHLRPISNAQCQSQFGSNVVVPAVICAVGYSNPNAGICSSDSGGPLVVSESGIPTQIGVVSFGAPGCGGPQPGGFMRTSHYLQWVNTHTGIPIRP